MESSGTNTLGDLSENCPTQRCKGFYDYYQIFRGDNLEDDESEEFGAGDKGELKGYTEGLHSPFGAIGQIREKTGYTLEYILWAEPWVNFILDSADAPRYVKGKRPVPVVEDEEDIKNILGDKIKIV